MSENKPMEFCEGQYHPASDDSSNDPSAHNATSGSPEFDYNNGPMSSLVRQKEMELRHVVTAPKSNKLYNLTFTSEDGLHLHYSTDQIGDMIEQLEFLGRLLESKRNRMGHK